MDRGASTAFLTQLLASKSEPCYLVEMYFDDGTLYATNAWKPVSWNGNTYAADGHFLDFSGLKETFDMQIPTVTVTFSGVDQSWISIALAEPYINRRVVIYKAFIDYVNGVVNSPVSVFDGRMDSMAIADDPDNGTCAVSVTVTNSWGNFNQVRGRKTNPNDQQIYFPGDRFFEFAGPINKQIKWGSA